jgi:hypothetical protein
MPENGHAIYRTDEEVIKALFQTGGNAKEAAKLLKLSDVGVLRKRIRSKPELKDALVEAREQTLDLAEQVVVNGMKTGSQKNKLETAKWFLSRKGRGRGYGDVVTNVNANFNVDLIEKAKKMPLEKRLEIMEYLDVVATNAD